MQRPRHLPRQNTCFCPERIPARSAWFAGSYRSAPRRGFCPLPERQNRGRGVLPHCSSQHSLEATARGKPTGAAIWVQKPLGVIEPFVQDPGERGIGQSISAFA